MPSNVWCEITCPFPNFNTAAIEVWEFHLPLYNGCNYLSMLGLELIHVNKSAWGIYLWSFAEVFCISCQLTLCKEIASTIWKKYHMINKYILEITKNLLSLMMLWDLWIKSTSFNVWIRYFAGLPTGTEFPYFVRNLHAKYGSTNLAYKIRKLSSVSSVT